MGFVILEGGTIWFGEHARVLTFRPPKGAPVCPVHLQHHQEADRGGTRAPGRPQETADFLAGPACEGNGRARENPLRPQPFLLSAPSSARTAYSVGLGEIEEDGVPAGVPPGWAHETRGVDT